jgi:hypothetical protein
MVAGRIQQRFDDYLTKQKLFRQIRISCNVASYPVDGETEEELLTKVS